MTTPTTTTTTRPYPEASPHDEIQQVFPDIFFVKGVVRVTAGTLFPIMFSRNMTVVRQGKDLVLVNSMRLTEDGLKELDNLGNVKHVIRLGGLHGMDDPFYKERYGATVWSPAHYFDGFDLHQATPYFEPDHMITKDMTPPIDKSRFILIDSGIVPEALLLMDRGDQGKVLVTGDSLQNWATLTSLVSG